MNHCSECIDIWYKALLEQGYSGLFKTKVPMVAYGTAQELKFYIVIYWAILKKNSAQELSHQMSQYIVWSIPGHGDSRLFK